MATKLEEIEIKLPKEIVDAYALIAKRAGVSVPIVMRVALAIESLRFNPEPPNEPQKAAYRAYRALPCQASLPASGVP